MTEYPRAENRMTPAQFSDALNEVQLAVREFCRITGTNTKTAERWLSDEKDIPAWVPVTLSLLTLPDAMQMARAVAQHYSKENFNG